MSENEFDIFLYFQGGKMDKQSLLDIFFYPITRGVDIVDEGVKKFRNIDEYLNGYVEQVIFEGKKGNEELNWWIRYNAFNISARSGKLGCGISIDFHRSQLNPTGESFYEGKKRTNLDIYGLQGVYEQANFLVEYSKFIWERLGGGLYAAGDWEMIFHTLHRKKIPIETALNYFWLTIVPNSSPIPEKYAHDMKDGGPVDETPWYRREKIKGGTLLVSSPLPWWSVEESPKQTTWEELEKKWKLLEKGGKT
jgi:hypothetical protein